MIDLGKTYNYGIVTSKDGYIKKVLDPETGGTFNAIHLNDALYIRNKVHKVYTNQAWSVLHWTDLLPQERRAGRILIEDEESQPVVRIEMTVIEMYESLTSGKELL